jgi:general secretion pathway protein G
MKKEHLIIFQETKWFQNIQRVFKKLQKPKKGITLVELVVVVMILGTLIWIFTANITSNKEKITAKMSKIQLQQAKTMIMMNLDDYKNEFGTYPGEDLGLAVLFEQVPGAPENWHAVVKNKNVLMDPWKNLYQYNLDENGQPVITSLGADKVLGGTGENADIILNEIN